MTNGKNTAQSLRNPFSTYEVRFRTSNIDLAPDLTRKIVWVFRALICFRAEPTHSCVMETVILDYALSKGVESLKEKAEIHRDFKALVRKSKGLINEKNFVQYKIQVKLIFQNPNSEAVQKVKKDAREHPGRILFHMQKPVGEWLSDKARELNMNRSQLMFAILVREATMSGDYIDYPINVKSILQDLNSQYIAIIQKLG